MSYGAPTPSGVQPSYLLVVNHDNGAQFSIDTQLDAGSTNEAKDQAIQDLADLLAGSEKFAIVYGVKSNPMTQEITATA
jgi:hypothetical protein